MRLNDNGIFNLSTATFNDSEKVVLNKGLKYVPAKQLNKFSTFIDIQKYVRKLNIQRYFLSNPTRPSLPESASSVVHSGFSNHSLFNPSGSTGIKRFSSKRLGNATQKENLQ